MIRQCSVCKKKKDQSEFYPQSRDKDYLRSECKVCAKQASRRYYELHREEVLATAQRRYHQKRRPTAKSV